MTFEGFSSGAPVSPVPQAFWRELVPQMSDPAELLVTLYALEAIARVRRFPRRLRLADLQDSRPLIESLAQLCSHRDVAEAFSDGLKAAVARGSLLRGRSVEDGAWIDWLAINDADGLRALAATSMPPASRHAYGREPVASSTPEMWQSAFGTTMPPILTEEVRSAESRFGVEWLRDAFAEAAAHNVRSWRYVATILERWESEGRDERDATTRSTAVGMESSRYRHLFRE